MSNFNKIRYGAVIEILMLDNVQPQMIHNWMTVVCGEDVLLYAMVKWWTDDEFRRGKTKALKLRPCRESGSPSLAVREENSCWRAVENILSCKLNQQHCKKYLKAAWNACWLTMEWMWRRQANNVTAKYKNIILCNPVTCGSQQKNQHKWFIL